MTPCRIHTRVLPVPDELMLFLDTSFLFLPTSPPDPRVLSFSKNISYASSGAFPFSPCRRNGLRV